MIKIKKIILMLILCLTLTIIIIPKTNAYESKFSDGIYYIGNTFDYIILNATILIEDDSFVSVNEVNEISPSSNTNIQNYRVYKYYYGQPVQGNYRLGTKFIDIRLPDETRQRVNCIELISSEMVYYDKYMVIASQAPFNGEVSFEYLTDSGWREYNGSGEANHTNRYYVALDFGIPNRTLLRNVRLCFYDFTSEITIERYAYTNKTSIYDSLEYYNGLNITIEQINPNFSDFLINSLGGFFNFEIIPGWSISTILAICIMIPVLLYVLKYFFGG